MDVLAVKLVSVSQSSISYTADVRTAATTPSSARSALLTRLLHPVLHSWPVRLVSHFFPRLDLGSSGVVSLRSRAIASFALFFLL